MGFPMINLSVFYRTKKNIVVHERRLSRHTRNIAENVFKVIDPHSLDTDLL
jgi:hypothetical protein